MSDAAKRLTREREAREREARARAAQDREAHRIDAGGPGLEGAGLAGVRGLHFGADPLEAAFAEARLQAPEPSAGFLARVLSDAEAVQPAFHEARSHESVRREAAIRDTVHADAAALAPPMPARAQARPPARSSARSRPAGPWALLGRIGRRTGEILGGWAPVGGMGFAVAGGVLLGLSGHLDAASHDGVFLGSVPAETLDDATMVQLMPLVLTLNLEGQ